MDNLIVETIIKKNFKKWLEYKYWKCRKTVKNSQCKCYKSSFLSKKTTKILDLHPLSWISLVNLNMALNMWTYHLKSACTLWCTDTRQTMQCHASSELLSSLNRTAPTANTMYSFHVCREYSGEPTRSSDTIIINDEQNVITWTNL